MDISHLFAWFLVTALPAWYALEKRAKWVYDRREKIAVALDQAWHAAYVLLPSGTPLQQHVALAHDRLGSILRGTGIELAAHELVAVDAQLEALHGKLLYTELDANPNTIALYLPPVSVAPPAAVAPPAPPPPPTPIRDAGKGAWVLPLLLLALALPSCVTLWPAGCTQTARAITCTSKAAQFVVSPHPTLPRPAAHIELQLDGQALPITIDTLNLGLPPTTPPKP